jgi:hypothetical protein
MVGRGVRMGAMTELTEAGQAGELMAGLARRHVDTHPQTVGFVYIDGHVRAYHGTRRLPKAHVARMRISMPATLETWIGDACRAPRSLTLWGRVLATVAVATEGCGEGVKRRGCLRPCTR